jgi:hypothetical protein
MGENISPIAGECVRKKSGFRSRIVIDDTDAPFQANALAIVAAPP